MPLNTTEFVREPHGFLLDVREYNQHMGCRKYPLGFRGLSWFLTGKPCHPNKTWMDRTKNKQFY